jgi:hypothetical protein
MFLYEELCTKCLRLLLKPKFFNDIFNENMSIRKKIHDDIEIH